MVGYFGFGFGSGVLALLVFFLLQWLHLPAGNLVDWFIGIASFWWLLAIVTVPWNIYFEAQEVLSEANLSRQRQIFLDPEQLRYTQRVRRWSLTIALILHGVSAIALYSLAASGVSAVGYLAAVATVLLTVLRPAVRAYAYLAGRLFLIKQQIQYPREDVLELRQRVQSLEYMVQQLNDRLDPAQEDSWIARQSREWQEIRQQNARLRADLEQMTARNDRDHEHLAREAKQAIAQLNEDSQFLGHVREIIHFLKTA